MVTLLYSDIFKVYYTHFKITSGPFNLIGSNWCDLFMNRFIFCFKSHLFFQPKRGLQQEQNNQSDLKACLK